MKKASLPLAAALAFALSLTACDSVENGPPASYEGERAFTWMAVTQSFAPDLQWVGGRAAAVGINRGDSAALDESLVWIMTAPDNSITSPLNIGEGNDSSLVRSFGGTPIDSLDSGETYTFWIADKAALDAGLVAQSDSFSFVDTTYAAAYALRGRSGGDPALDVEFRIIRDQGLVDDRYLVFWEPSTVAFSQIALRRAGVGGFSNLLWHVVQEEEGPEILRPPLVIGETPPGGQLVIDWPEEGGFTPPPTNYTLWMSRNNWDGESFSSSAPGYAFFQIFSNNFR